MSDDNLTACRIALSRIHGMTIALAREIIKRCGSEELFFSMGASQLTSLMGFTSRIFDAKMRQAALENARRELAFVKANDITIRYFNDDASGYPKRLLECDDAPCMLFTLGTCDLNDGRFAAIVGTRHATVYGSDFTSQLVKAMATTVDEPVTVVSGLAYGIDVAAHKAALEAGLPTVAVLAHGLNMIYPAQHRNIAAEIVARGGALVTEYTSSEAVHKGHFLARNRIVAGMIDALMVMESDIKGGALFTARLANDYGRDVWALPGRTADKYSRGCNMLISRNIAGIITDTENLITALAWRRKSPEGVQQELFTDLKPLEQKIIDLITKKGEARISDLKIALNEQTSTLLGVLIDMEFRHLLLSIPGGRYRLA